MGKAPRIENAADAVNLFFQYFANERVNDIEAHNRTLLETENVHELTKRINNYGHKIKILISKIKQLESSIDHFYRYDKTYKFEKSPILMYVAILMLKQFEYAMLIKMYNGEC